MADWVGKAPDANPLLFEMERQKFRAEEAEAQLAEARELIEGLVTDLSLWRTGHAEHYWRDASEQLTQRAERWLDPTAQEETP